MTNRSLPTHPFVRRLAVIYTFAIVLASLVTIFIVKWDGRFFSNFARLTFLALALLVLVVTAFLWIYQALSTERQERIQGWIIRFLFEQNQYASFLFYSCEILIASILVPLAGLMLGFHAYAAFISPFCLLSFLTSLPSIWFLVRLQKQHGLKTTFTQLRNAFLVVVLILYIGYIFDRFLNDAPFRFFKLDLSSLGIAADTLATASTFFTILFLLNIAVFILLVFDFIRKFFTESKTNPQNNLSGKKAAYRVVLFLLILVLGIFLRVSDWQNLPAGLNQDEASAGVDAYYILHYGMDRNGVSWPVYFQGFGNGATPLYTYLLVPFVALGGLTVSMVRLPALLFGILTLPLVYGIGRRLRSTETGLLAMLLVAICPWHILLSRWGLDCNLLPFVFSIGFLFLLYASKNNRLLIAAFFFFALCFYAYASAYVAVPIFLAIVIPLLIRHQKVKKSDLAWGIALFCVLISPIVTYVAINIFNLPTLQIGPLTILHLPSASRFEHESILFGGNVVGAAFKYLSQIPGLFISQSDQLVYNGIEPFGFMYIFSTPLFLIGLGLLLFQKSAARDAERFYLAAWVFSPLLVGAIEQPNIHRLNLIFIPFLFCLAIFLDCMRTSQRHIFLIVLVSLLAALGLFTKAYHGETYKAQIGEVFFDGFLPALSHAQKSSDGPICVTDKANMPYIYTLFNDPIPPAEFLQSQVVSNASTEWQLIQGYDRYTFGLDHCEVTASTTFVLHKYEALPDEATCASRVYFGNYSVYLP